MAIAWNPVIERAKEIVLSYDTEVTLRQLYYRLVATQLIPNSSSAYKRLSSLTAEARRQGEFPDLTDRTRMIHVPQSFSSPEEAMLHTYRHYRRDRTEGQPSSVYLAVEKDGMVVQLQSWFGNDFGLPILALSGYSSQSYVNEIRQHIEAQDRPVVILYGGDFDASGMDITRDFSARLGCEVQRIALSVEQVVQYNLPVAPGKDTDSRAAAFTQLYGDNVQVELDALDPNDLRALYQWALDQVFDYEIYDEAITREIEDRAVLARLFQQ